MINKRHVLVLNKLWIAVQVITLRKAIGMLFTERAIIVDPSEAFATYSWREWAKFRAKDGEEVLHGTNQVFRIPEVILLMDYDKLPNQKLKFSRRMIHKRDHNTCQYCGSQPGLEELTIDHLVPRSKGGLTIWSNTVSCCVKCNQKKNNRSLEEAGMRLIRQPKKPEFSLFKVEKRFICKSWKNFVDKVISEAYWTQELVNDN